MRLEINVFIHASTSKCLCIKIVNMLPACLRFKFIIPVYVGHWLYYAKPSTNVNFWMFTILIIVLAIISVLVLDLLSQDSLPFWHWESRALQKIDSWNLKQSFLRVSLKWWRNKEMDSANNLAWESSGSIKKGGMNSVYMAQFISRMDCRCFGV